MGPTLYSVTKETTVKERHRYLKVFSASLRLFSTSPISVSSSNSSGMEVKDSAIFNQERDERDKLENNKMSIRLKCSYQLDNVY